MRHLLPGIAIDRYCEPVGCERCFYTGYAGRRAVYEVIPMDDELAAAVRSGRTDVAPLLAERGIPRCAMPSSTSSDAARPLSTK